MGEPAGHWARAGLARRSATIAVGAPLLIAALWFGGLPLVVVVVILAAAGAWEFERLAQTTGVHPSPALMVGAIVFPLLAGVGEWDLAWSAAVAIVAAAAALTLLPSRRAHALGAAGADVLGALYAGALLAYVLLLRAEFGFGPMLAVLGLIWANDITAYLVGVKWGRHKLAPAISPGKSVEGFLAGLAAAVAVGAGVAMVVRWPPARLGVIGLLVALAAVVGDLWESALKRTAGVKDSGDILPGHGGVLDRFDAVLFGVPVGYYLWGWLL